MFIAIFIGYCFLHTTPFTLQKGVTPAALYWQSLSLRREAFCLAGLSLHYAAAPYCLLYVTRAATLVDFVTNELWYGAVEVVYAALPRQNTLYNGH